MLRASKSRAFTLLETVMALLILISALIIVTTLFHRSLQYFNKSQDRAQAATVARNYLTRIRVAAEDPVSYLAGVPSYSAHSTTEGNLTVTTRVQSTSGSQIRMSPSRFLEQGLPASERRQMPDSFLEAYVHVRWPDGPDPGVELYSIIGEPVRVPDTVEVTGASPSPVPPGGFVLTARLVDGSGDEIKDVSFRWWCEPGTSRGTLSPVDRFGRQARFFPTIKSGSGAPFNSPPGNCTIRARAIYDGVSYENTTAFTVNL